MRTYCIYYRTTGKLTAGVPRVAESWGGLEYQDRRQDLPIWAHRGDIINTIRNNQVLVVDVIWAHRGDIINTIRNNQVPG